MLVSPKTYSLLDYTEDKEKKALKGVSYRNNTVRHEHLLKAVYEGVTTQTIENVIRIKKTVVKTVQQVRNAVNPIFTKLRLSDDRITINPLSFVDDNNEKIFV